MDATTAALIMLFRKATKRFGPVCVNPNCERGKPHYH